MSSDRASRTSHADTPAREHDDLISVRVVLGALARAWDESDPLARQAETSNGGETTHCSVEEGPSWVHSIANTIFSAGASSYSRMGEGGTECSNSGQDSSSTDPVKSNGCRSMARQKCCVEQASRWTFRESVLMAYEGVLKQIAGNGNTSIVSLYFSERGRLTREAYGTPDFTTGKSEMHTAINWSNEAVDATPTMCELLTTMVRHTEGALFEAEVNDLFVVNAHGCYCYCASS